MPQSANPVSLATVPEMYERWLVGPLFQPFAEVLLDRVAPRPGERLLDIACGTGIVARLAKARIGEDGHVVGVDVSPAMLAVARSVAPGLDWREGNASALPIGPDERFEVIVCQQGLQFFPDRPAAAREMHRAIAPRGRIAVASWRPIEEMPFFRDIDTAARRRLGPFLDQRHAFGVAADLERLLVDAGFHDVRVETVGRTVHFDDASAFLRLNAMAVVGMSPAAKEMGEAERASLVSAIASESAEVIAPYARGRGVAFELRTNLALAVA